MTPAPDPPRHPQAAAPTVTTRADAGRYLDVEGAAARLGVNVSFVRRLVLERRVRYYKLGKYLRFDPADLDALVAASRVEPVPSRYDPLRGRPSRQPRKSATRTTTPGRP